MCAVQLQCFHQAHCVIGHIQQCERRLLFNPEAAQNDLADNLWRFLAFMLMAETNVAIVKTDNAVAAANKVVDQLVWPHGELAAKPHNQKHRRSTVIAVRFIGEFNSIGGYGGHGLISLGSFSCLSDVIGK